MCICVCACVRRPLVCRVVRAATYILLRIENMSKNMICCTVNSRRWQDKRRSFSQLKQKLTVPNHVRVTAMARRCIIGLGPDTRCHDQCKACFRTRNCIKKYPVELKAERMSNRRNHKLAGLLNNAKGLSQQLPHTNILFDTNQN